VQIVKISLGAGHSIALSVSGKVYSWGMNLLGQLGHGDTD
jgi:alpha-tubulin suppressor-like RCC1 family protein